jgi:hypothetical protein
MGWDSSDIDLKEYWDKIQVELDVIRKRSNELENLLRNINGLKMTETTVIAEDKLSSSIVYVSPVDLSGNAMDEDKRVQQKAGLIVNIKNYGTGMFDVSND